MATIYKLLDPDTLEVRYIGVTRIKLSRRLNVHLRHGRLKLSRSKLYEWIHALLNEGKKPIIQSIMDVKNTDAKECELVMIQSFKLIGHPLLNTYKMY